MIYAGGFSGLPRSGQHQRDVIRLLVVADLHQPLLAEFVRNPARDALLELEHHDLGIRSQPQRWSPGSCSARSEDLHLADPA